MIKFLKQKNKNKGFTLVETLVAISIFSMSIVALMSILGNGISNTNYAKQKIIAGYLAQEGIEYIRNMRDTYVLYTNTTGENWDTFKIELDSCKLNNNGCGINSLVPMTDSGFIFQCSAANKCDLYINNGNYNTDPSGIDSGFTRVIQMVTAGLGSDEVKIYSTVQWTQPSGTFSVEFSENLFNWIE